MRATRIARTSSPSKAWVGWPSSEHRVVGQVDQQVVGPLAQGVQPALDHQRRGDGGRHAELDAAVTRAALGIIDRERIGRQLVEPGQVDHRQRTQRAAEDGRQLAGEAVMPPEVGPMRQALVVDLDDHVARPG